jgi:hypothetical protein
LYCGASGASRPETRTERYICEAETVLRADLLGDGEEPLLSARREHDIEPLLGKYLYQGDTDSCRRSRDENRAPGSLQ